MDQAHKNSEPHDNKDQAENLRMLVQDVKGKELEDNQPDDERHAEEIHPATAEADSADHDDVTDRETVSEEDDIPQQQEEKAEEVMEHDANVVESGADLEREEAGLTDTQAEEHANEFTGEGEFDVESAESSEWSGDDGIDEAYLNQVIEELCMSKAEEFAMLGYEGVTGKDIWDFVSEKYAQTGIPPLHKLINDILSLRPTHYMNWLTLSAYKGKHFLE